MKRRITRSVRDRLEQRFLVRAAGDTKKQLNITIKHHQPHTSSKISILIIASDQSEVDLDATVVIMPDASDTETWLEIKVLTSGEAIVRAAPNLRIQNNHVTAGHALSTKHLSPEEIFYLASRGLEPAAAERLVIDSIVKSFSKEGIIAL